MAKRITFKNFPEWSKQKEIFEKWHMESITSPSVGFVMFPKLQKGETARKALNYSMGGIVPPSKFITHLLDIHGQHCNDCSGWVYKHDKYHGYFFFLLSEYRVNLNRLKFNLASSIAKWMHLIWLQTVCPGKCLLNIWQKCDRCVIF